MTLAFKALDRKVTGSAMEVSTKVPDERWSGRKRYVRGAEGWGQDAETARVCTWPPKMASVAV